MKLSCGDKQKRGLIQNEEDRNGFMELVTLSWKIKNKQKFTRKRKLEKSEEALYNRTR